MVVMANKMKIKAIGLVLLGVFILTACGQKRDLYLPEDPVSNNTTTGSKTTTELAEKGRS
jgi:predicted small lipoprotein YifL|tara:strand:+ start:801 stop:980 length:180 start_codon:yes stop_codon:yes gene_type:complete